jgi:23S rRNA pseudouridine2605 synthase
VHPAGTNSQDRPVPKAQRLDRLRKDLAKLDDEGPFNMDAELQAFQGESLKDAFKPNRLSGKSPKAGPKKSTKGQGQTLAWPMRLNRMVSLSGLCSRRMADSLIEEGKITVNGKVTEVLGTKVQQEDLVAYQGQVLTIRNFVYVLLNKPKDYITTLDDPEDRKTVMDLVSDATGERIVPAGRLDRNTTGLLLLTNDGDLIQKLTHPSSEIAKIYAVELDKPLIQKDFNQIVQGVTLEDGFAAVDALAWPDPSNKRLVGLSLHSGKNRIVRRIFEHLGYEVERLDRVSYAGLTKKDLPRGEWRYLTEKEVRFLHAGKKVF